MSTRGYYGYKQNNQINGVEINYDAYLSYAGKKVLNIIKNSSNEELLNFWQNQIELVTELSIFDLELDVKLNLDIDELRKNGYKILDIPILKLDFISNLNRKIFRKENETQYFADGGKYYKRAIFCEFAYILNFDKKCLEIWNCYNLKPEEGYEDWVQKDFEGKNFYMKKLDTISFQDFRKTKKPYINNWLCQ